MKRSHKRDTRRTLSVSILVFSPSGSTRRVADAYATRYRKRGHAVRLVDVTRKRAFFDGSDADRAALLADLIPCDLLLAGGPIYIDHMQYNLLRALDALPGRGPACAAVFSTFGKVAPGVGLAEAARRLDRRGCRVVSALEVDATHSATRTTPCVINPHLPGAELDGFVTRSIEAIDRALAGKTRGSLDLVLGRRYADYPHLRDEREVLDAFAPVTFDERACTGCGRCVRVCPVCDLTLAGGVVRHGEPSRCISCTECLTACPAGAAHQDLTERTRFVMDALAEQKLDPEGPSRSALWVEH